MCELVTASLAIAAVASAASAAYGSYAAGQQAEAAEKVGQRNARIAEIAERDALARSEIDSSRVMDKGYRMISRAKVVAAANGLDLSSEGFADTVGGIAQGAATDVETIKNNAARQAWGLRNQGDASLYEGQIASSRARGQQVESILGGVGSAASLGAQAFSLKGGGKSGLVNKDE